MAQYAVLIYASDSAHAPEATPADTASCDEHADELVDTGSMLVAYALTPRDMATSIRAGAVTDGPFLDAKEMVAGFYVIEAPDLDAALTIAGTNPAIREGGGVEVRPVHSGGMIGPCLSDGTGRSERSSDLNATFGADRFRVRSRGLGAESWQRQAFRIRRSRCGEPARGR